MADLPILTKQQILDADDIDIRVVPCPEWGGAVRVRSMSGADRDSLAARTQAGADGKLPLEHAHARVAAMVIVDADGKRMFNKDDLLALSRKNIKPLDRIFQVAMEISAMTATEVAEIEGNSAAGQTGDFDSD